MKHDIHPIYGKADVFCANCKNKFQIGSTQETLKVDICSNCHPFYTGKQVLVDTAGRVERFKKRYQKPSKADA